MGSGTGTKSNYKAISGQSYAKLSLSEERDRPISRGKRWRVGREENRRRGGVNSTPAASWDTPWECEEAGQGGNKVGGREK